MWLCEWCRLALFPLALRRAPFHSLLPPPLQRQHKARKDWRQSDVLWFILPESLRMLSVPHEGSDESRLSVRHLIIRQKKSLWCYPLTMAHSSLLTTVPTNNEEVTAATNGDGVVPTVHLRVWQMKAEHWEPFVALPVHSIPFWSWEARGANSTFKYRVCKMQCFQRWYAKTVLMKTHYIELQKNWDVLTFSIPCMSTQTLQSLLCCSICRLLWDYK